MDSQSESSEKNILDYLRRIAKPYRTMPARSALSDQGIMTLANQIDLRTEKLLVDYGCGQGRLLYALRHSKSDDELSHLSYVGVDVDDKILSQCAETFSSLAFPASFRFTLMDRTEFGYRRAFLADYITVVFSLHEMDVINIDNYLADLWSRLRVEGKLLIQDASTPMHREIEYICFTPDDIASIFKRVSKEVQVTDLTAGKTSVPLYIISLTKLRGTFFSFYPENFRETYLHTMRRSLTKDLYDMYLTKEKVCAQDAVDISEYVKILHRVSVKTRAIQQIDNFTLLEQRQVNFCIKCGSENIRITHEDYNVKDPGSVDLTCLDCSYQHFIWIESPTAEGHENAYWHDFYTWLDGTSDRNFNNRVHNNFIRDFLGSNDEDLDSFLFLLDRIPDLPRDYLNKQLALIKQRDPDNGPPKS